MTYINLEHEKFNRGNLALVLFFLKFNPKKVIGANPKIAQHTGTRDLVAEKNTDVNNLWFHSIEKEIL